MRSVLLAATLLLGGPGQFHTGIACRVLNFKDKTISDTEATDHKQKLPVPGCELLPVMKTDDLAASAVHCKIGDTTIELYVSCLTDHPDQEVHQMSMGKDKPDYGILLGCKTVPATGI